MIISRMVDRRMYRGCQQGSEEEVIARADHCDIVPGTQSQNNISPQRLTIWYLHHG